MYRGQNGGLRYDHDNVPLVPEVIQARLYTLSYHHGDGRDAFIHAEGFNLDPQEEIDSIERGLAYLCRYGRLDLEYWEEQPVTRMVKWLDMIGDMIKAEKASSPSRETDYT